MRIDSKLLRTSTFRLAAAYLFVFVVSVGSVLAYVYWNTAILLERQIGETVQAEVQGLAEQYRLRGMPGLVETVALRSSRGTNSVYILTDPGDRRIVGNLDTLPPEAKLGQSGWVEFSYAVETAHGPEQHRARAFHIDLANGSTLVVGRDVEERRNLADIIRDTLFWAIGITLVLGTAGGLWMSRNFLTRVDAITSTARSIMAGELSRRVPVGGSGDELDRLAVSLNDMLDQIGRLMDGMREVTSNVAHDLRTPLTRMRARLEDALRAENPESGRAAITATLEDADRLLQIFNALLSIARAESGQLRASLETVRLADLLQEVAELYAPSAEEQGGSLTITHMDGVELHADRQLLAQALSNVIDNALKYGLGPQGHVDITIATRLAGDEVEITIADQGPGISEADRERVFGRFVRLDSSRSAEGSGLGLALVQGVMRLHHGRVLLADNGPGLALRLVLPCKPVAV